MTPLFNINFASTATGANYVVAPDSNVTSNTSEVPAGLTAGTTALTFGGSPGTSTSGLNGAYSGVTTGTAAQLLAAIDNPVNWTFTGTAAPAAYDTSFMVTGAAANSAPTFNSGMTATAPENTPTTTTVYTAAATDLDNDTLTYSLSGADAGKFNISAMTGAVTFITSPNFEAPGSAAGTNTYSINALVMDGAGGHTTTQAVTINVTDVNDNAPVITSGATTTVPSGTAAGTTVYTATASDADTVNGARTYALGGTDAAKFNINATTGNVSFVTAPNYFAPDDAGADHVYDITVSANDGVNTSAAMAVQVTVTNTNPNPPVFTSGAAASTPENVATTTAVYTAHATDADGDTVTYSLVAGGDAALFNINPTTGAVTFKASPDFEKPGSAQGTNTYSFTVQASDGATVHNVNQAVSLAVTDVNDNSPVITSAATATAPAGVATTTTVYTVAATDADSGPALAYSISGGADAAKFNINASTGAVTFVASPAYTPATDAGADHVYDIVVQASDGVTAHNATKAVAITLTNPGAGVLYANTFDTYTGAGLSPGGTTAGTLDSNVFMAVGFSDPQPGYGGTAGTGDYGRGVIAPADNPSTAGLYSAATAHAGAGDHAVVIPPTGAEFDVNGYVELRVQNTTANTVTGLTAAFDWVSHNTGDRSDNLTLSYSVDGVNYTTVPASAFSSPATTDPTSPVPFVYTNENLTLGNIVVAPGAYLYLHFNHTSSTGSGNRDEVGFDNVNIAYSGTTNVPVLSVGNLSQNEGNSGTTAFTFTVNRAGDTTGVTTVHYATADGTATSSGAGADYTAVSGDLTFTAGQTSKAVTVLVNGDTLTEGNETFTLNLSAPVNATFQNTAGTATILNDDNSATGIADIQGASQTSPLVDQTVNTAGVVTAIKTGAGGGFFIQDSLTTGPAGASHGIFVFTAATPTGVAVGDAVNVRGLVAEFTGAANDRSTTELNNPTFTVSSHNNAVTPVIIGAGGVLPPTTAIAGPGYDPVHNGVDFYESLEGQLVTIKNAQAVDTTFSNSTWVVADNGAEATGINARGGITVSATDFNPERIQIFSSALSATMGEHLGDITGYITYFGGEYELVPTAAITPPGNSATAPPALPRPTTTLHGDATHVSIGAYNVENLGPVEPGVAQATVDARFAQLGVDIAQNLGSPDILGLEEIQDADGEGTGADLSGAATLNKLIAAIKAAGGPTYQYIEIAPTTAGSTGGAPGGNIRSAYLYNPARVGYVAGSAQLISDPNLADGDAFNNSRKPLAAQFVFNGQTINAIDVHDYARSGSEELFGADQPPVNSGDQRRVDQTSAVKGYVAQILAANPAANVTVQGDFNGFQFEPTLTQLTHAGGGQLNQLSDLLAPNERYSTTFEGDAQEIDHLLVSDSLNTGAQFNIVHLNTGQPVANQASDHDPIVSLLAVGPQPVAAPGQPSIAGATAAQPVNDNATVRPFSTVIVSDTSPTAAETVTVTLSAAANGTLAGGGFTQTSPGVYTFAAASAAAAQAALQALVFTPTANQVAPGQTTSTGFTVTVVDGAASATDMRTTVTTTSVNDAPTLGGFQATATAPSDTTVTLQPNLTVSDPDVGAMVTGATVSITAPTNGDRLAATAPAGITAAYSAATGVLTLTGTATDAAYQQALRSVTYLHDGATDPGTRTIVFSVNDGQAAASMNETVSVAGFTQPTAGGGGNTGSVPTNLDIQQAFPTQTSNLLRTAANDPALQTPSSPLYAQAQAEKGIAVQLDSGQITLADAQNALYHLVDGTTSVAEISYAFFTGTTPSAAGLNYLVHSDANPTDLNDGYYAQFSTENRYINFAVNLSTGVGAGAAAFQANYGSLSLSDATAKAYAAIFGVAPATGKIDAILNAQVSNGLGGTETRAQYFADISGGTAPAQKAAAIGFLLADSVKEGFGTYQQADLHFLADLAHGTAVYNVDLLAAYAQAPGLVGQSVVDQSLPH